MNDSENARVIQVDCGAVLEDAGIQLPDGTQKPIWKLAETDYVLSGHDTKTRVQSLIKCQDVMAYAIRTSDGRSLQLTAEQCLLTKYGWRRARRLKEGDEIMSYDYWVGRAYVALVSVEHVSMKEHVAYTIALKEKTFIANGFICSDYDMQYGK